MNTDINQEGMNTAIREKGRERKKLISNSHQDISCLILIALRRGRQKLEILILSLTRPISLCIRVSAFLSTLFSLKIAALYLPRRKWHLDIRHSKGFN